MKSAFWRGYLTAFWLYLAFMAFLFFIDFRDLLQGFENRKILLSYYEVTHGKLEAVPRRAYTEDGRDITEQIEHLLGDRECLRKTLLHGGWIGPCYNFDFTKIPQPLTAQGFNSWTTINAHTNINDFDRSLRSLIGLVAFLILKTWAAWMFTGKVRFKLP